MLVLEKKSCQEKKVLQHVARKEENAQRINTIGGRDEREPRASRRFHRCPYFAKLR